MSEDLSNAFASLAEKLRPGGRIACLELSGTWARPGSYTASCGHRRKNFPALAPRQVLVLSLLYGRGTESLVDDEPIPNDSYADSLDECYRGREGNS